MLKSTDNGYLTQRRRRKMKKVLVLIFVVVMVFSIVACGAKTESTSNDSTEQYTLKLAHVNNAAYPYTDGSELFKKLVEEGTDGNVIIEIYPDCLLYTSDAADEEDSVDLGGR